MDCGRVIAKQTQFATSSAHFVVGLQFFPSKHGITCPSGELQMFLGFTVGQ